MPFLKSLANWIGLDRAGLFHALQLTFAAWLSFTIAAAFHLHNAYWAAMSAWVVAQATRGLMLERGFFRIVGTLLGVGIGFLLLYATDQPYLKLTGFSVWIALCAALLHVLRGVHAYGALMGGITAAIIVLPSVMDPDHTVERAVARVECTLIGVVVVTLITGFFTPGSQRDVFYRRVRKLAGDAVAFTSHALRDTATDAEERAILTEISDVDANASLISAGSVGGYRRLHHVHALVGASLEVMAAGVASRDHLQREAGEVDVRLPQALNTLAEHLRENAPGDTLWHDLEEVRKTSSARLDEALKQLRLADYVLFREPRSADAKSFGSKAVYLAPHHDWDLARQMALVCGLTAFLAGAVGFASGWPAGLMTALGVTIFSMILSSVPWPQKLAPKLLIGIFSGVCAAVIYRLTIQPHITTMAGLLISVFPFMLIGSLARASRRTAISGLEACMCFMFISQAGMPATPPLKVFMDAGSIILGAAIVGAGFLLIPRRPINRAKVAATQINRDLVRMLKAPLANWQSQTTRQILRLMSHLTQASELGNAAPRGLLSALNLGHAIKEIQKLGNGSAQDAMTRSQADKVLGHLYKFTDDPYQLANDLVKMAENIKNPTLAMAVVDAASALQSGASLFQFAKRPAEKAIDFHSQKRH